MVHLTRNTFKIKSRLTHFKTDIQNSIKRDKICHFTCNIFLIFFLLSYVCFVTFCVSHIYLESCVTLL